MSTTVVCQFFIGYTTIYITYYVGDTLGDAPVRDLESCDVQFPWQLSELGTPNESGLIPVRVSEVSTPSSSVEFEPMQAARRI